MPRPKSEKKAANEDGEKIVKLESIPEDIKSDNYMSEKSKVIGKNIRTARKRRNFSVENLAECLELSISYIGLLERGDRTPSLKNVYKICELFGTTPNELLVEENYADQLHRIFVAENKPASSKNKIDAIVSLLSTLSDTELEFVLSTIQKLKKVNR